MREERPFKFRSLAIARSFVNRCEVAMGIVLGDDMKFWVVTLAEFERLLKCGYEQAR